MYGKQDFHSNLRKTISYFCKENYSELKNFYDTVEIRRNIYIDLKEYIDSINIDKAWATGLDITVSSFLFDINIAVYKNTQDFSGIEYIHLFTYEDRNLSKPLMILINENFNHFKLIYPNKNKTDNLNDINIEDKNIKDKYNNICNKKERAFNINKESYKEDINLSDIDNINNIILSSNEKFLEATNNLENNIANNNKGSNKDDAIINKNFYCNIIILILIILINHENYYKIKKILEILNQNTINKQNIQLIMNKTNKIIYNDHISNKLKFLKFNY